MTPRRYQRSRKAGWTKPADTVIVTRPFVMGNPWTGPRAIDQFHLYALILLSDIGHQSAWDRVAGMGAAVTLDSAAFAKRRRKFREQFIDIAARRLNVCCFCPEASPCHGDIILGLADLYRRGYSLQRLFEESIA